jgi:glycosyltransferase involved in cell wall biosynthesis
VGVPRHKIRVIHYGVDLDFFRAGAGGPTPVEQPILLYVGRLEIRKRVDRLMYAMQQVCRRQALARLLVVGEGPERKRLEKLAAQLGVAQRISFLGEVSRRDLLQLYQSANLFVFPSEQEGFGFVLAEALACGRAVVALDTPATREIVGDGGILVNPEDITCLGRAILETLDDVSLIRQIERRARRRAEEFFDWKENVVQYLALYTEAMPSGV